MTITRYSELRRALLDLSNRFEDYGAKVGCLYHQLVQAPNPEEPPTTWGWNEFMAVNTAKEAGTRAWEHWRIHQDRIGVSRFWGDGQRPFDVFMRLSSAGYDILWELRTLTTQGQVPPGTVIDALPCEQANWQLPVGMETWLLLLNDSAINCPTVFLNATLGNWNCPSPVATRVQKNDDVLFSDHLESCVQTEGETGKGDKYPKHPTVVTLNHDVFWSSAEAIKLWLGLEEVVPLGDWHNELPMWLPADEGGGGIEEVQTNDWPRWDADTRTLYVGSAVVKQFEQPAENQEPILEAFQRSSWRRRIDDPLPERHCVVSERRLTETCESLNENHITPDLIWFKPDGKGEGIIWCPGPKPRRRNATKRSPEN